MNTTLNEKIDLLISRLNECIADATFVKLTLSNYRGSEQHLQRLSVRPVTTKKGSRVLFQYRFETRDVVKNYEIGESIELVRQMLASGFRNAHLFSTKFDVQLEIGKRNARLKIGKPTITTPPPLSHDKEKRTLIDPNAFYLKALGIATDKGEIRASQQDKWRQINSFVEILGGLFERSALKNKKHLRIADMGSGKGYLTFAAYDHFQRLVGREKIKEGTSVSRDTAIQMTGVEMRIELVELCNGIAKAGGFDGLNFIQGSIADLETQDVDILIALHACDTATDDALYKGVAANASIIVAAPCCHKELRKQIKSPDELAGILKHGIMLERMAESVTDGIRALLLESRGYSTKIFEFVPSEHTPKNNMLVAVRTKTATDRIKSEKQIENIKKLFGIRHQRLEELLKNGQCQ